MATKKKEQTVEEKGLADIDWSTDAGAGFETVQQDDLGLPMLQIVQKMSPEVDEDDPKYIEGVKPGDVLFSLTKKCMADKTDPLVFVPCGYQKAYVEWAPRETGGGYVTAHKQPILSHTTKNEKGQDVLATGNLIVTTAYVFGFVYDEDEKDWIFVIISMSSTQLKKARQWLNIMSGHKMEGKDGKKMLLPMFSHKYNISTQPESNEHGTWYGWKIECSDMVSEAELVGKCREQHKAIRDGSMAALAAPEDGKDVPF
jgi:hypothetical protein